MTLTPCHSTVGKGCARTIVMQLMVNSAAIHSTVFFILTSKQKDIAAEISYTRFSETEYSTTVYIQVVVYTFDYANANPELPCEVASWMRSFNSSYEGYSGNLSRLKLTIAIHQWTIVKC